MKKASVIFASALMILTFASCKKEASGLADDQMITKVNSWLEKQKTSSQPMKAANIDLLVKNLEYSRTTVEESSNNEKIIIIPIAEGLKTAKSIDNKSIPTLVLMVNSAGMIRKGNVVLYSPDANSVQQSIPRNTFYAIYNTAEPPVNGKFKFLSVTGSLQYELMYKNNILYAAGEVTRKSAVSPGANGIAAVACTEWYLVTTYHYADGTTETTTEYVGTTCSGCDQSTYEGFCPNDDSGGVGFQIEYEYEVARSMKWKVFQYPDDPVSSQGIWSVERIRGKRVSTEPDGGHFTSLENFANYCEFCGQSDTWARGNHTYSIPTPQTISCTVWGNLIYDGRSYSVDKTNWWSFAGVF